MDDINRVARALDREKIRLHPKDEISIRMWIDILKFEGANAFCKDKLDRAPLGSGLSEDLFCLVLQTKFQSEMFQKLGNALICIDATHNATCYSGMPLFTIMVRDHWGHGKRNALFGRSQLISDLSGVPVAWMVSSNSTNETIKYFLRLVKSWNPDIRPAYMMTDCDQAQIAALEAIYPQSQVLLCTWHVLRAVQSHFRTDHFPELWALVKKMVHTPDLAEFSKILDKISSDPAFPESFVKYFRNQWVPTVHLWAGIGRRSRSIYEESNTNMLLEG
jgi:hypothetical protein